MPQTISSEYSLRNHSCSHEQDSRSIFRRHKPIKKTRSKNFMRATKLNSLRQKRPCKNVKNKIMIYSPEYNICIRDAPTPLYHSDQYEPSITQSELRIVEPVSFKSYIDAEMLKKLYEEKREERELVSCMTACKIRQEGEIN